VGCFLELLGSKSTSMWRIAQHTQSSLSFAAYGLFSMLLFSRRNLTSNCNPTSWVSTTKRCICGTQVRIWLDFKRRSNSYSYPGSHYRPVAPYHRPPVMVYRPVYRGCRYIPTKFKIPNQTRSGASCYRYTSRSHRLAGRLHLHRLTGRLRINEEHDIFSNLN
jgi:hypothetical protein